VLLTSLVTLSAAQNDESGPTDEKARKTYKQALEFTQQHMTAAALDSFKKSRKADGGHCVACQEKMIKYGLQLHEWKTAETAAEELLAEAQGARDQARAHYRLPNVLVKEGMDKHEDEILTRTHDELTEALAAEPNFPDAIFADGLILARLQQDDAAKARFDLFVKMRPADDPDRQHAMRYINDPDLARARMAPPVAVTTLDGQRVSLDDLKDKVVPIDFWAAWRQPCREALPHMRDIARKFQGPAARGSELEPRR
jgi:hypothetical protein